MKKYNSLIRNEDFTVDLPRTDCQCHDVRNHSHEGSTNRRTRGHLIDTSTYAQVHFMGDVLKPTTHKSRNPRTWELR
jgi:hypothetical protein